MTGGRGGGSDRGSDFIPKKNHNFRICLPKKITTFFNIRKKSPLVIFSQPKKMPLFFFATYKKSRQNHANRRNETEFSKHVWTHGLMDSERCEKTMLINSFTLECLTGSTCTYKFIWQLTYGSGLHKIIFESNSTISL